MKEREQFVPDHAIDLFVWVRSRVHLALTYRKSVCRGPKQLLTMLAAFRCSVIMSACRKTHAVVEIHQLG